MTNEEQLKEMAKVKREEMFLSGLSNRLSLVADACRAAGLGDYSPGIGFFLGIASICSEAAEYLDEEATQLGCQVNVLKAEEEVGEGASHV